MSLTYLYNLLDCDVAYDDGFVLIWFIVISDKTAFDFVNTVAHKVIRNKALQKTASSVFCSLAKFETRPVPIFSNVSKGSGTFNRR